ncbi:MAG: hypothetical protein JSU85_11160 [Candidatus Zixiibacteriota bacterium]|nr:MAG: hypothetical protein JSU85_11160 [candidate division Zixibacteria bacterium]
MRKLLFVFALGLIVCSGKPGPKDVVFEFIRAVYDSDSTKIVNILDVDAYNRMHMVVMSPEDSAAVLEEYRVKTIQSLLGDGEKRAFWTKSQILVNKEHVKGDFAEVDVSFIDRVTGVLLYTKIQLEKQPDGSWKIVYFK